MYLLFAWRYFKAKKSTQAINLIAWTSMGAIVIGTASLILVLSVFNGFEGMVKSLYSSFYSSWRLTPVQGKTLVVQDKQLEAIDKIPGVTAFSRVVEEKALLQAGDNQAMVQLKGVDEAYPQLNRIDTLLVNGNYSMGTAEQPQAVLGIGVADALGVFADRNLMPLTVYLPKKTNALQLDWTNDIQTASLQTVGTFMIQQDFDNRYAIVPIQFMQVSLGLTDRECSSIEIATAEGADPDAIRTSLQSIMGTNWLVQDRYQQNQSLYAVMRTERWIVYAVLSLLLVVAAFTMIGALTMLVLEKQKDISVLMALGTDRGGILRIFLAEGVLLAAGGGLLGMGLAALLALMQIRFHLIPMQGGSFLIDYYPVALQWVDFVLVGITVLIIALIASWLPAYKASRTAFNLRAS
ncbi:MAG: FtsX-like permease family protein [Sphingomonadales bacterium]|nr:FtsX-like permease family protein [Sphingomonadales bacterium]